MARVNATRFPSMVRGEKRQISSGLIGVTLREFNLCAIFEPVASRSFPTTARATDKSPNSLALKFGFMR